MSWKIHQGDALEVLRTLPDESVQCCVTSPPYWGLRAYGNTINGPLTAKFIRAYSESVKLNPAPERGC